MHMTESDASGDREPTALSKAPVEALRAFAIAYDRAVRFVQVGPKCTSVWTTDRGTYPGMTSLRIDHPYSVDFEMAADMGLLERCDPTSDGHPNVPTGAKCYRWDMLSKSLDDLVDMFEALERVARLDYEEAKDIPGAVPVVLVGRLAGAGALADASMAASLAGDAEAHYAHGYMVGETKRRLMLRGVTMPDGAMATEASLKQHGMGLVATQMAGVTTFKGWNRLVVGMSRDAFLEVARTERRQVEALVEAVRIYEDEKTAAGERLLEKARCARMELARATDAVRLREGLADAEGADDPAKARRLAVRLIDSLARPAADVVRDVAAMDGDGTPKRRVAEALRDAGMPCTNADYRTKLSALLDALDLAEPGWNDGPPSGPAP
jgi:hypothetical protein